jgi:hypothetical protein
MSPREKAIELYNRFFIEVPFLQSDDDIRDDMNAAKRCALIAVDEMEEVYASAVSAITKNKKLAESTKSVYLQEVKQEIEKL